MRKKWPLKLGSSYLLCFSEQSDRLATSGLNVWIWDLSARKKLLRCRPLPNASHVRLSPSGEHVVVKGTSGRIVVASAEDGRVVRDFRNVHEGEGGNVEWSEDGRYLVDGSWNGVVRVRDVSTGAVVFERSFPNEMIQHVKRDFARQVWTTSHSPKWSEERRHDPNYVTLWTWPFSEPMGHALIPEEGHLWDTALSPNGARLAVVYGFGQSRLAILKLPSGECVSRLDIDFGTSGGRVAWSADGVLIALTEQRGASVRRADTLEVCWKTEMAYPTEPAFSPDGQYLALGSSESGLLLRMSDLQME